MKQGSHISPEDDDTIFPAIRTRRKEVKVDTEWVLQEDVLCRSPSFAAMLVIGKHITQKIPILSKPFRCFPRMGQGMGQAVWLIS